MRFATWKFKMEGLGAWFSDDLGWKRKTHVEQVVFPVGTRKIFQDIQPANIAYRLPFLSFGFYELFGNKCAICVFTSLEIEEKDLLLSFWQIWSPRQVAPVGLPSALLGEVKGRVASCLTWLCRSLLVISIFPPTFIPPLPRNPRADPKHCVQCFLAYSMEKVGISCNALKHA